MPIRNPVLRWLLGLPPLIPESSEGGDWRVTAVVPAYNEEDCIGETVISLKRQTVPLARIVVVDDCSTDRTGALARDAGATVVRTPRNTGKKVTAQAFGLAQVSTPYVLFVDADTVLAPNALECLLRWMRLPRTGAVCAMVLPHRTKTVWEKVRLLDYLVGTTVFKRAQNHIGAVVVASGCCALFRRAALESIGGLPNTGSFAEDMDATWRVSQQGWRVWFEPRARCWVRDPDTWRLYERQMDRWYRGFLQSLWMQKYALGGHVRLLAVVVWMAVEQTLAPLAFLAGLALFPVQTGYALAAYLLLEVGFVGVVSLVQGVRLGMLRCVIKALPALPLLRAANFYLWYRALWRELRGKRLTQWHKGH